MAKNGHFWQTVAKVPRKCQKLQKPQNGHIPPSVANNFFCQLGSPPLVFKDHPAWSETNTSGRWARGGVVKPCKAVPRISSPPSLPRPRGLLAPLRPRTMRRHAPLPPAPPPTSPRPGWRRSRAAGRGGRSSRLASACSGNGVFPNLPFHHNPPPRKFPGKLSFKRTLTV